MAAPFRIAIVTGSSRGMGRDTVIRLAERGVSSIVTYNARRDEADKVVAAVKAIGAAAVALQLDVVSQRPLAVSLLMFAMPSPA